MPSRYASVFRPGLFEGQVAVVTGGGAIVNSWIASSGLDNYPPEMAAHIRSLPKHVPLSRLGTESEVSAAICYLLSPAAAFISGSCIRVDGAVPNAKRQVANKTPTPAFDGFHLASIPKVLG